MNRPADPKVNIDELIADPVSEARKITPLGAPHEKIALPRAIFGTERANSAGLDLSNEQRLGSLASAMLAGLATHWQAGPILATGEVAGEARMVLNPADTRDKVGQVIEATPELVSTAFTLAQEAAPIWQSTPPQDRAATLQRAADLLEARLPSLVGLIVREAGKTIPAVIGEVREAVDFLRYYAHQIAHGFDNDTHRPLGPVVAISPWNFPLAIFIGQISAALAAGNVVLAKPAEETPLIAAAAVHLLLEAGIPPGALQMLPGDGRVGAALITDTRVRGVLFTGSTEVARLIQAQLADRLDARGLPIPLVAETGGQNAMVVDSSALPEQAVADIIASAFDSAGQRCSALRILLVQEDIAPRLLAMLHGAMAELSLGRPDHLATDIGPVISAEARQNIAAHVEAMRTRGYPVFAPDLTKACAQGWFMAPTVIEIPSIDVLGREVFGPVLHVLRYKRTELNNLISAVNGLGYGLTFGIHSRIEESITHVTNRIHAGNIYVNRNIIGAVVGVQPFGGHGLSGTGPKAGGPLYLRRLLAERPAAHGLPLGDAPEALQVFLAHLQARKVETTDFSHYAAHAPARADVTLPGPVGELNQYRLLPRGKVLCRAATQSGLLRQIAACLATGNTAAVQNLTDYPALQDLPPDLAKHIVPADTAPDAALFDGDANMLCALMAELAAQSHAVVTVHSLPRDGGRTGDYPLEFLLAEQSISTNTAAAGGNASLMTIG
jgi:RHH-type proline utilization regulon transcriptional repressor/proline dehydrogenase/delta 1-pyrroline-5-carboxylate dehydrogenase